LPDARVTARLPPHPLLRLSHTPNAHQKHRAYPRTARGATYSRRSHQGSPRQRFDKRSARRAESIRAPLSLFREPHAHHRDLLARPTTQEPPNPASTKDQDRHIMSSTHVLHIGSYASYLRWFSADNVTNRPLTPNSSCVTKQKSKIVSRNSLAPRSPH